MSEQQKSGGGFPMAFTAGLVVGVLVGAFAAVVIPPFLGGPGELKPRPGTPSVPIHTRDERPAPAVTPPATTPTTPGATPATTPGTTPATAPAGTTPPATTPPAGDKPATPPATAPR